MFLGGVVAILLGSLVTNVTNPFSREALVLSMVLPKGGTSVRLSSVVRSDFFVSLFVPLFFRRRLRDRVLTVTLRRIVKDLHMNGRFEHFGPYGFHPAFGIRNFTLVDWFFVYWYGFSSHIKRCQGYSNCSFVREDLPVHHLKGVLYVSIPHGTHLSTFSNGVINYVFHVFRGGPSTWSTNVIRRQVVPSRLSHLRILFLRHGVFVRPNMYLFLSSSLHFQNFYTLHFTMCVNISRRGEGSHFQLRRVTRKLQIFTSNRVVTVIHGGLLRIL